MTIESVRCAVDVRQPPAEAFELFAARISDWWSGKSVGKTERASITIEPRSGGRWFETDRDGMETPWGKVLAWEPPSRLLLAWELNSHFEPDPSVLTEIELRFQPLPGGGTRIALEHRNLERFGTGAETAAASIGKGWPIQLGSFTRFTGTEAPHPHPL